MRWLGNEILIAAIDGSAIIYVIIMVIWFLSWIVKAIKGAGQGGGQPGQPPRPQNKQLGSEIDAFLKEVSNARRPQRRPSSPTPSSPTQEVPIEIVADAERQPPKRQPPKRLSAKLPSSKRHVRPGQAMSRRKVPGSKNLGKGVREHVEQHLSAGRIGREVARDLGSGLQSGVLSHLGQFHAMPFDDVLESSASSRTAREIVRMLRDRNGVRQAVLLSEILSRPKGLQRKR